MKNAGTFMQTLSIFVLAMTTVACSKQTTTKQLAHDFYITQVDSDFRSRFASTPSSLEATVPIDSRAACNESLKVALCETTATKRQITSDPLAITCAADSAKYVDAMMELFDETPEKMRLSLCTLERVFISDQIDSTAFASALTDEMGEIVGGYIGFRKGSFVQQPSIDALMSWKEQLAFGGSTEFLSNDPNLVQISFGLKMTTLKQDGLFYVLMHELGHLVDFKNRVNSEWGATPWSRLSWQMIETPLKSATFLFRDDFCYYRCTSYLNPGQANDIYASLLESAFMTTYAGANGYEDFAEFWTWRLLLEEKSPNYQITVPGSATISMMPVFTENAKIRAKIDFIEQLWASPDLKIDNRQSAL